MTCCVIVVYSDTDRQQLTVFLNSDIPEFATGIGGTQHTAWTGSVGVRSSVWIPIVLISPCGSRPFPDTAELPTQQLIFCRTNLSTSVWEPAIPTVIPVLKWILSIISGVNSLPGLQRSYDWFRLQQWCRASRFTALLRTAVCQYQLSVLGLVPASTADVVFAVCH